jgi:hypothetical protein
MLGKSPALIELRPDIFHGRGRRVFPICYLLLAEELHTVMPAQGNHSRERPVGSSRFQDPSASLWSVTNRPAYLFTGQPVAFPGRLKPRVLSHRGQSRESEHVSDPSSCCFARRSHRIKLYLVFGCIHPIAKNAQMNKLLGHEYS